MTKLCTLREAVSRIPDGAMVGLGGNTLNRAPMAAVFEMIRQLRDQKFPLDLHGQKPLSVIKYAVFLYIS